MEIKTTKQIQYMKPDKDWAKRWVAVDDIIKWIEEYDADDLMSGKYVINDLKELLTSNSTTLPKDKL